MSYDSLLQATKFHKENTNNWIGESLAEYKHQIYGIIKNNNIKSILDYGCGKAKFHNILFNNKKTPGSPIGIEITKYDPAVEEYSIKPLLSNKFELVLCIDVMEHVQEDRIEEVLQDIFNYGNQVFMTITCYPATQILPNGLNAHYTVKEPDWWKEKLKKYENKCIVIFQTKPDRSKITINKEEWVPSKETLKRLSSNDKRLDSTQIEKSKLLHHHPGS